LVIRRCGLRIRILQRDQPHDRLADLGSWRADGGERGSIHRLADQDVLEKDDAPGGIRRRGLPHRCQPRLRIGRPRRRARRQGIERLGERRCVTAPCRHARVFQLGREVSGARRQRVQHALRVSVVRRAAEPLELQREGIGGLEIRGVERDRPAPVAHRTIEVPFAAVGQRQQPFDRRVAGREL
jgi:hypothetical protein